jgi:GT2 family glycosyltransferase
MTTAGRTIATALTSNELSTKPLNVSVIIPSFEDRGHLGDLLRALVIQQPPLNEIIVSHSGSGDPSQHVPMGHEAIRVLHQDEQLFSGAARNAGVAAASGKWLAFIDDDVIPAKNWSANLARLQSQASSNTCFVGSIDADLSDGYWGICLWFLEFGSVHSYMPSRTIEGGASANMFLPRSLYDAAGGFPENVDRCVDVEFMACCRENGGHTSFDGATRVSHHNISSLKHCLTHAISLGCGSARVRQLKKLRGDAFVKMPLFIPLLIPARLVQMTYRVGRWGKGFRLLFLMHLPGILLALIAWSLGFARCARRSQEEGREGRETLFVRSSD